MYCTTSTLVAQTSDQSEEKLLFEYEQSPQFPGGDEALIAFIKENLNYPQASLEAGIEGRVTVRFTITSEGVVTNALVIRGLDSLCDKEALRVVKMMPTWIPGRFNGKPVPIFYTLPVVFKLQRGTNDERKALESAILAGRPVYRADVMPHFRGGEKAMFRFIKKHIRYPNNEANRYARGLSIIRFIVTKTGKLTDVRVIRSLSNDCDFETVRVVKMMSPWKPGTQDGKPVDVFYTLPISFEK